MRKISYIEAINEALVEEMHRDESVFVLGESIQGGLYGATNGLVDIFGPDRVMDTPISETAIAGVALGSAERGLRPIADFMQSDFMFVAMDEIVDKAAKFRFYSGGEKKLPLVFMASIGGYFGVGDTHGKFPVAYYMHTPGLKIALPSTPYDAKGLMKSAIRDNNPVMFFFHKALVNPSGTYGSFPLTEEDIDGIGEIDAVGKFGEIPDEDYTVPLGKADIKRKGDDITIVASSLMVHFAAHVAEQMKGSVSIEVVDPRTIEPLDMETILQSVKKTGRVIVVDEDTSRCGPAGEIAMQIYEKAYDDIKAPIQRVAAKNYPIPLGSFEKLVLPHPDLIVEAVDRIMKT